MVIGHRCVTHALATSLRSPTEQVSVDNGQTLRRLVHDATMQRSLSSSVWSHIAFGPLSLWMASHAQPEALLGCSPEIPLTEVLFQSELSDQMPRMHIPNIVASSMGPQPRGNGQHHSDIMQPRPDIASAGRQAMTALATTFCEHAATSESEQHGKVRTPDDKCLVADIASAMREREATAAQEEDGHISEATLRSKEEPLSDQACCRADCEHSRQELQWEPEGPQRLPEGTQS